MPACLTVHSSLGPSLGQDLRGPVSLETFVRSGPCHCGQSPALESKTNVKTRTVAPIKSLMPHQVLTILTLELSWTLPPPSSPPARTMMELSAFLFRRPC